MQLPKLPKFAVLVIHTTHDDVDECEPLLFDTQAEALKEAKEEADGDYAAYVVALHPVCCVRLTPPQVVVEKL